jgi:hypothetical protein
MDASAPREFKIAADEAAARDHLADPATNVHRVVAAQVWRAFKALGNTGGHVLTIGDGSGELMGLPAQIVPRRGSKVAHVDAHDNVVSDVIDINRWDEREDFDAVIGTLAGYDVRLTYPPNIVRRRADHIIDASLCLAVTKPGGLIAIVATHDLMDNPVPIGRSSLADLADLVGAVRFPAGVYRPNAVGTDEVADLLILRRREPGAERKGADWEFAVPVTLDGGSVFVNTYFDTAVDQVLGSTQYDPTGQAPTNLTVVGSESLFPGLLTGAMNNLISYGRRIGLTAGATAPAALSQVRGRLAKARAAEQVRQAHSQQVQHENHPETGRRRPPATPPATGIGGP